MLSPLPGTLVITQLFGSRHGGAGEAYTATHDGVVYHTIGHVGIDFQAAAGTPVRAMKSGTLTLFGGPGLPDDGYSAALGLHAVITLPTGEQHWYAHLSSALAGNLDAIDAGAVFALSGFSGNVEPPGPEGAHLHVAIRPPHPNYANGADGFEPFLTHFNPPVYALIDTSLV